MPKTIMSEYGLSVNSSIVLLGTSVFIDIVIKVIYFTIIGISTTVPRLN